jgi:pyruvate carboxylase
VAGGYKLSDKQIKIPNQESLRVNGIALQCRITTEDPANSFQPDYGTITTYRSAAGFGIRLDAGSLYQGVKVSPFFDSLLVKVSAQGRTLDGACRKMHRALREFRIRGVKTNIPFLLNILEHPVFVKGEARVGFIEQHKELFKLAAQKDRATKAVSFLAEVTVNGNPDVTKTDPAVQFEQPVIPEYPRHNDYPQGTKNRLTELGPDGFCHWLKEQKAIQYTDTTFRDAHQSLLATRVRSIDLLNVAEAFAKQHAQTFSMEVWGGATFDVCLRFLYENPWARLRQIREAVPNILLQMLLRGSNAVGYKAYPDNLIEKFVVQSAEEGIDIFRIFDSLNWLKAMEPSINYVRKHTNSLAEVCLCYTGDILDSTRTKFTLEYYTQLAKDIENAGAHILAIKDMAGLLKPYAARELVLALKDAVDIPIHLHTHDTSSLATSSYMQAIEAGVDVVDVAIGALSGLTSQPNFNAVAAMMQDHPRNNPYNLRSLNEFSNYWEATRKFYYPFESGLKAGTAEVFTHEIPGGQYSNLKRQAQALGLSEKFTEVTQRYAEVNQLFGDIVKVTPSSKVVGDMALFMVNNQLSPAEVLEKGENIDFPESVESFFRGELGQPAGGFPAELQQLVLKGQKPFTDRPNEHLKPVDFDTEFASFNEQFAEGFNRPLQLTDFLSWKLYPKVWEDAYKMHVQYDDISKIPTKNFLYGLKVQEETVFEIAPGKSIIVDLLSIGQANAQGVRTLFFRVNGQPRNIEVVDKKLAAPAKQNEKADLNNNKHMAAPLQGRLSRVFVKEGQEVAKNEPLFVIEAMKMETNITANAVGTVAAVVLEEGTMVKTGDLIVKLN